MTQSERPLVSVIIPNYNHGRYLASAIDSVLAQSCDAMEIIVVDNWSTDASWEVIQSYSSRGVRGVRFDNQGIIAAGRNHALSIATGTLVAFLDADDSWVPDKLARQLPHFEDEAVLLVASESRVIGDVAYSRPPAAPPAAPYIDVTYDALVRANSIATSSVVARASSLREVGGFDEDPDFRFIEDWELWLRLCLLGRLRLLTAPLINYRLAVDTTRDLRDVARRRFRVLAKHARLGAIGTEALRRAKGNIFVDLGRACLDVGDREGVKYYLRGVRMCESNRKPIAVVGLLLFAVPVSIRRVLVRSLYRFRFWVSGSTGDGERSQEGISG